MIRKVLVPLDGSPTAEQGLGAACRIAAESGATLLLVRAVPYLAMEGEAHAHESRELKEARSYLDNVERDLARQDIVAGSEVFPCDPAQAILFAAEAHDVDMISICTHGRSGIKHALVGSVAEAVLRRSTVPVLLTRATAQPAPLRISPYSSILVPLDGTSFAESALFYLRRQRLGREASLCILRVVAPATSAFMPGAMGDGALEALVAAEDALEARRLGADAYLRALSASRLADRARHARVVIGDVEKAILDEARHEGAELIVLATHARHGWDRLFHGSVTGQLLRHATTPMLILRGASVEQIGLRAPEAREEVASGRERVGAIK
jgi:nucleotide-binding universal stress UspA family protein